MRAVVTPATVGPLEAPVAIWVTFRDVPSERITVAVKGAEPPTLIVGSIGETSRDVGTAFVTVRVVEAVSPMYVTVIVVVPGPTDVARPMRLMVATMMFDEAHVAMPVTLRCVPLENTSVAVKPIPLPSGIAGAMGAIDSE